MSPTDKQTVQEDNGINIIVRHSKASRGILAD